MEQKNLDMYGNEPIPWSRALVVLESANPIASWWLSTTRPDGRPHCTAVGARWVDGVVYVVSGAGTRKSRNRASYPTASSRHRFRGWISSSRGRQLGSPIRRR